MINWHYLEEGDLLSCDRLGVGLLVYRRPSPALYKLLSEEPGMGVFLAGRFGGAFVRGMKVDFTGYLEEEMGSNEPGFIARPPHFLLRLFKKLRGIKCIKRLAGKI